MICVRASLAVLGGSAAWLAPPALHAAPAREALVIGNGTYSALPPLPACLLSAHAVAAALRGLGFHVVEREDVIQRRHRCRDRRIRHATGGGARAPPPSSTAAATPRRSTTGRSCCRSRPGSRARPTCSTQGVLAKSLIDVLARGGAGASVVAIDVVPVPEAPAALHLDALTQGSLPDGLGLIAASQAKPPDAPTPLAAALDCQSEGTGGPGRRR